MKTIWFLNGVWVGIFIVEMAILIGYLLWGAK